MTALIIGIILIGIVLVILEILVLPGMVSGILGVIMIIAGVSLSYNEFGSTGGNVTLLLTVVTGVIAIFTSLKARSWNRFGLKETIDSHVNEVAGSGIQVGETGTTISALRPSGTVQIDGQRVEAHSHGEWIDSDSEVIVVKVMPNKIIVKLK